jgi:glycine/D-amino acid oxidase-like deaminating enzyme
MTFMARPMVVGRIGVARIGAADSRADYPPAVERRWTDPGYAPAQADVVVIGGGIIGSTAAAIMADRGAGVVLVEQSAIGAGASGRNLGAIQHPFDPVLGGLYAESLARYRALASLAGYGFTIGDEPAGLLLLSPDLDGARAQALRIDDAYPELRPDLIEPDELQQLEPSLAPGPAAVRLATGYPVPPSAATAAWAGLAEDRGAVIVVGAAARPIERDGRATGVVLSNGWTIASDAVLVTAGPWTPLLVDPSGTWRPIHPTWGVTVQLNLDGHAPRHIVEEDEADTLSRAVAATERAEQADDPNADPPSLFSLATARGITTLGSVFLPTEPDPARIGALLLRRAAAFLPAIVEAEVVGRRMCARPQSVDGRPFIGEAAHVRSLFVCAGHGPWGISTGPASAAIAARAVLDGTAPPPELDAARPT